MGDWVAKAIPYAPPAVLAANYYRDWASTNNLEEYAERNKEHISMLETEAVKTAGRLAELETLGQEATVEAQGLRDQLNSLSQEIGATEASLSSIFNARMGKLETQYGQEYGALVPRVSGMESTLSGVETGLSALIPRVGGVESGLSGLESQYGEAASLYEDIFPSGPYQFGEDVKGQALATADYMRKGQGPTATARDRFGYAPGQRFGRDLFSSVPTTLREPLGNYKIPKDLSNIGRAGK